MTKIKNIVKRDRIRVLEYFQDHDTLRKGALPPTKFRSTLHSQKVQLTDVEYNMIESYFALPNPSNAPLVNYVAFCDEVAGIFTQKDLEKIPTKRLTSF